MEKKIVRKKVEKLYHGYLVSIRDYEAQRGIDNGGIVIVHKEQIMHLSPEQIKNADWEKKVQKSKFGKPYRLVNIRWNPNQNDKQESLF